MADMVLDMYLVAHDQFAGVFEKLGVEAEGLSGKIGLLAGGFGVLAGGVLAESVKQASDYSSMINHVAANTTMTTQGINEMSTAIQDMAAHSSAHMDDLAQAWMHVTDLGFTKAADAQKVVQAAMESALSTGGSVVDTANVLANAMHEFGIKATDAGHAMDVLHLASAEGNTTLEQFTEGAGRAIGFAANLGVSMTDAAAAVSALTRHGYDASTASTQLTGILEHIANPAAGAQKALAALSQQTGIDLVHDFSEAGLKSKGLSGVLADVERATHGNSAEILKLIPALRGGLGAIALTGTGAKDYQQILGDLNETMAGKSTPTAEAYARTQQTLGFQVDMLKNNLQEMAISIGSAVLPALTGLVQAVMPVVQGIARWMQHHGQLVAALLAGVAVVGTLIGALMILGPVIAAIASPVGIVVLAIGAAVAGLVALTAHSEGVRAFLAGIWSSIVDDATALWAWLNGVWAGITQDAQTLWEDMGGWLMGIWQGIVGSATAIWGTVSGFFTGIWGGLSALWQGAWSALSSVLQALWGGISSAAQSIWGAIGPTLTGLWTGLVAQARLIWGGLGDFFGALWDSLTGDVTGATQHLLNLGPRWQAVVSGILSVFTDLRNAVGLVWDTITGDATGAQQHMSALSGGWQTALHAIGTVFSDLGTAAKKAWDALASAGQTAWNHLIKPVLDAIGTEWKRFAHDVLPLLGPALHNIVESVKGIVAPLVAAFSLVVSGLAGAWKGFWEGGAGQFVRDGFDQIATVIKGALRILEDALVIVIAAIGGKWGVAWDHLKDIVGTTFGVMGTTIKGSAHLLADAVGAVMGAIEGVFTGLATWINDHFLKGALKWGEDMIENLKKGIGNKAHELYEAVRNALGPIGKLFPKSPAEEGPLSVPPDFTYIAGAMIAAIPQVRAAATTLMGSAGLSGGAMGIDVGAAGGLGALGGNAATFNAGHTVTIAPTITIQGGTFTNAQGISDLAHAVSEEIMHSVRLQGGLLPQM